MLLLCRLDFKAVRQHSPALRDFMGTKHLMNFLRTLGFRPLHSRQARVQVEIIPLGKCEYQAISKVLV